MGQIVHSQYESRLLMLLYNPCPKNTAKIRVGGALPAQRLHTEPPPTKLLHGKELGSMALRVPLPGLSLSLMLRQVALQCALDSLIDSN